MHWRTHTPARGSPTGKKRKKAEKSSALQSRSVCSLTARPLCRTSSLRRRSSASPHVPPRSARGTRDTGPPRYRHAPAHATYSSRATRNRTRGACHTTNRVADTLRHKTCAYRAWHGRSGAVRAGRHGRATRRRASFDMPARACHTRNEQRAAHAPPAHLPPPPPIPLLGEAVAGPVQVCIVWRVPVQMSDGKQQCGNSGKGSDRSSASSAGSIAREA